MQISSKGGPNRPSPPARPLPKAILPGKSLSSFPLPPGSSASLNILLRQWGNECLPVLATALRAALTTKLAPAGSCHFLAILYNIQVRRCLEDQLPLHGRSCPEIPRFPVHFLYTRLFALLIGLWITP